jgi:hypothetical protein
MAGGERRLGPNPAARSSVLADKDVPSQPALNGHLRQELAGSEVRAACGGHPHRIGGAGRLQLHRPGHCDAPPA